MVLCIVGLVMLEMTRIFYGRWVVALLYISLGGYLLIFIILLISSFIEDVPYPTKIIFQVVGWILNMITGSITITRYAMRKKHYGWLFLPSIPNEGDHYELACGIISLVLAVFIMVDMIVLAVNRDQYDEDDEVDV